MMALQLFTQSNHKHFLSSSYVLGFQSTARSSHVPTVPDVSGPQGKTGAKPDARSCRDGCSVEPGMRVILTVRFCVHLCHPLLRASASPAQSWGSQHKDDEKENKWQVRPHDVADGSSNRSRADSVHRLQPARGAQEAVSGGTAAGSLPTYTGEPPPPQRAHAQPRSLALVSWKGEDPHPARCCGRGVHREGTDNKARNGCLQRAPSFFPDALRSFSRPCPGERQAFELNPVWFCCWDIYMYYKQQVI